LSMASTAGGCLRRTMSQTGDARKGGPRNADLKDRVDTALVAYRRAEEKLRLCSRRLPGHTTRIWLRCACWPFSS
jgi:hypothetical protein